MDLKGFHKELICLVALGNKVKCILTGSNATIDEEEYTCLCSAASLGVVSHFKQSDVEVPSPPRREDYWVTPGPHRLRAKLKERYVLMSFYNLSGVLPTWAELKRF
ncbi:hypothetical protein CHARACLAT_006772 [Characodon lateralis]|uniref:Uncharacterized protein n=1 Tax=Characodon lateralis TaxID=208331 RepID=A0ABU7EUE5_9TELE|nr:hypothetical protein [Characodon lateralis]